MVCRLELDRAGHWHFWWLKRLCRLANYRTQPQMPQGFVASDAGPRLAQW
jgi:hypothetical protein